MAAESKVDLDEVLAVAVEAAKKAGAIIKASFGKRGDFRVDSKGGVDMVTTVDHAAEKAILELVTTKFPTHKIIAEESSAKTPLTEEPTWLIDPLDGTTNFVHGYQFCCVSIGFAVGGDFSVGVVYNSVLEELYTAVKGGGAFLNGEPIRVSDAPDLGAALVVNNVGAGRDAAFVNVSMACVHAAFTANVHSVRMTGSAAVNMCHVACGRVDAYWELLVGGPWDLAAGTIIVREAGGVVTNCDGSDFEILRLGVLCANKPVGAALATLLHDAVAGAVAKEPEAMAASPGATAAAWSAGVRTSSASAPAAATADDAA